jgi:hypothetical protein
MLLTFQGPKKSRFSGLTPSNRPRNSFARIKIITRAIYTTGTLIVNMTSTLYLAYYIRYGYNRVCVGFICSWFGVLISSFSLASLLRLFDSQHEDVRKALKV